MKIIRILFVDDNESERKKLEVSLNGYSINGCKIWTITLENPSEAINYLENDSSINLVLHDLHAKTWDGDDSIKAINDKFPLIPIIAFSNKKSSQIPIIYFNKNDFYKNIDKHVQLIFNKITESDFLLEKFNFKSNLYNEYIALLKNQHKDSIIRSIDKVSTDIYSQIKRTHISLRSYIGKIERNAFRRKLISRRIVMAAFIELNFSTYDTINMLKLEEGYINEIEKRYPITLINDILQHFSDFKKQLKSLKTRSLKRGISLKIGNELFKFDVELTSKIEYDNFDIPLFFIGKIFFPLTASRDDEINFYYFIDNTLKKPFIECHLISRNFNNWLNQIGLSQALIKNKIGILNEELKWLESMGITL